MGQAQTGRGGWERKIKTHKIQVAMPFDGWQPIGDAASLLLQARAITLCHHHPFVPASFHHRKASHNISIVSRFLAHCLSLKDACNSKVLWKRATPVKVRASKEE